MISPSALISLVLLAGTPTTVLTPADLPGTVACTPAAVDTVMLESAQLVTGKVSAIKDDAAGGKLVTLRVERSWKGAAAGTDLTVHQDPDAAGEANNRPLDFKVGTAYFIAATAPSPSQKVANLTETCGTSAPLAAASGLTWELDNGPIEAAARVAVLDLLTSPDASIRARAINRLAEFKDNDSGVYSSLRELALKDPELAVRVAAGRLVARGAIAGKVEFKVAVAMLVVNDADVGPEVCHAVIENTNAKSKFKRRAVSALQKVIVNRKEKEAAGKKKKRTYLKWSAQQALACLEGHEGTDSSRSISGDYDDAWGK